MIMLTDEQMLRMPRQFDACCIRCSKKMNIDDVHDGDGEPGVDNKIEL